MTDRPHVLDLFCGAAGGWSLGLHWAGYRTVAACEADPWRREMFGLNNPRVKMYGDIRTLGAARLVADGIVPDIVVGSPPCQDISCANPSGRGVDGERSGLFFQAIRIVRDLGDLGRGPRWVCLENSPRLLGRGIDRVLDALDEAGYAGRPLVVGAADVGAPHLRRRCWIIANSQEVGSGCGRDIAATGRQTRRQPEGGAGITADSHGDGIVESQGVLAECRGRPGDSPQPPAPHSDQVGWTPRGLGGMRDGGECKAATGGTSGILGHHWFADLAAHRRGNDGIPAGVARECVAAYGDAVVPRIAEMIGRAILAVDPGMGRRAAA